MFYAPGFDPALIIAQIVAMQSLLYLDLVLWLCVLRGLAGADISSIGLEQIFSPRTISVSYTGGWIAIVALFLNSLAGGCFLCVVVERAKKCLDFAATAHVIHLGCCILYDGVPGSWEWWVINAMSLVVMSLVGEFLCMRREMQDIPLFSMGRTK